MKLKWQVDVVGETVQLQVGGIEDDGTAIPIMGVALSKVAFDAIVKEYKGGALWTPPPIPPPVSGNGGTVNPDYSAGT